MYNIYNILYIPKTTPHYPRGGEDYSRINISSSFLKMKPLKKLKIGKFLDIF